jgi:EmrB/QacA subfamily drug resistance transporter
MCFALILVVASVSALNLAMPDLAIDLGATDTSLTWIADAYTLALATLVLPFGALGDRWGRRRVLVVGTALFALSAVAAALTDSASLLIVWRAVMGAAAAMIMPGTLSTITAVYPASKRARAAAIWSGCAAAGVVLGMVVAGALLERWGWQSIFVVSAAVAVLAGAIAAVLAPDTREQQRPESFDATGALSTAVAVGALVYAIIEGNEAGWSEPAVLVAVGLCLLAGVVYLLAGLRHPTPLLDPRLFRLRGLSAGSIAVVAQFMAIIGFLFVGLQYLQLILEYSPFAAALALTPVAIVVVPMSQLTPRLVARAGLIPIMTGGLVLIAGGLGWLATLDVHSGYWPFLTGLVLCGVGVALSGSSATAAIIEPLPRDKQGIASAINDATREVGGAIGIALMGSICASQYRHALPAAPSGLPVQAAHVIRDSAAGGLHVAEQAGSFGSSIATSVRHAFMQGLSAALVVAAIVLIVAAVGICCCAVCFRGGDQCADELRLQYGNFLSTSRWRKHHQPSAPWRTTCPQLPRGAGAPAVATTAALGGRHRRPTVINGGQVRHDRRRHGDSSVEHLVDGDHAGPRRGRHRRQGSRPVSAPQRSSPQITSPSLTRRPARSPDFRHGRFDQCFVVVDESDRE